MIDEDTVTANANKFFGGNKDAVPRHAITQGVADILESRKIILIAKGIEKAEGVRRSLEGEIGPDAPASFLRLHPNVSFILDREAASLLSK
jgi:glucosamine-6-phosphate deaminase